MSLTFDRYQFEFALRPGYKPYAPAPVREFTDGETIIRPNTHKSHMSPERRTEVAKARWEARRAKFGSKGVSAKGLENLRAGARKKKPR